MLNLEGFTGKEKDDENRTGPRVHLGCIVVLNLEEFTNTEKDDENRTNHVYIWGVSSCLIWRGSQTQRNTTKTERTTCTSGMYRVHRHRERRRKPNKPRVHLGCIIMLNLEGFTGTSKDEENRTNHVYIFLHPA